jgi:hypothetical protein
MGEGAMQNTISGCPRPRLRPPRTSIVVLTATNSAGPLLVTRTITSLAPFALRHLSPSATYLRPRWRRRLLRFAPSLTRLVGDKNGTPRVEPGHVGPPRTNRSPSRVCCYFMTSRTTFCVLTEEALFLSMASPAIPNPLGRSSEPKAGSDSATKKPPSNPSFRACRGVELREMTQPNPHIAAKAPLR